MALSNDPVQIAFRDAVSGFRSELDDEKMYCKLLETKSIKEVYDMTEQLQVELIKKRRFNHLGKIAPFLQNLAEYAKVIEVFVQAKSEMALIWGPIKLVLQWASVMTESFKAIVDITAEIGALLPEFKRTVAIFGPILSPQMKEILMLFFRDMLDFYAITLKFFSMNRLSTFFEALWPRRREKIKVIMEQIKRHTSLFRNERQLEHIQAEHQARLDALRHFELTEKAIRRQEYLSIRANIDPITHEAKLDELQARFCDGTDKWLLKDTTFQKWLDDDGDDDTSRFLWLQGIPAAGKSFLSSVAVSKAQISGRTVFAFLSYTMGDKLTALSIIHSLIFQLVNDHDDLQEVLCRLNTKPVKSNMNASISLLTQLASCCASLRLIVDGVDEINDFEQIRLLKQLLLIQETCKGVRVLVSCRATGEITRALKEKKTIRVDQRNSGAIRVFIDKQVTSWFEDSTFDSHIQKEIRDLLAPLSTKAKGMFLYARVIIAHLRLLGIEDIRKELRAPPEDLDDAYSRVVARLENTKSNQVKDTAFKILGWIGCAPTPLTVYEIESALQLTKTGSSDFSKSYGKHDIVQICGPIIEVVDEYVQFVHFTFKEYIFAPHLCKSIDLPGSILSLASCCVTHFNQMDHDIHTDSESLAKSIVQGKYIFHNFASVSWIWLVMKYSSSRKSCDLSLEFVELLQSLMLERPNEQSLDDLPSKVNHGLKTFESMDPDLYVWLCKVYAFQYQIQAPNFDTGIDGDWTRKDPTSLSSISLRICSQFETLLCKTSEHLEDCPCSRVVSRYGKRIYKCQHVNCDYYRHGFESTRLLERHLKDHEHPLKCNVEGCAYERGGFLSRKMRDDHMKSYHKPGKSLPALEQDVNEDEIFQVLLDLVKTGDAAALRQLDFQNPLLSESDKFKLVRVAARLGSLEIFETLYETWPTVFASRDPFTEEAEPEIRPHTTICDEVLRSGQADKVKFLISKFAGNNIDFGLRTFYIVTVLESDSEDIWSFWKELCEEVNPDICGDKFRRKWFPYDFARQIKGRPDRAQALLSWWRAVGFPSHDHSDQGISLRILKNVVDADCLLLLAYLLDNGIDVDSRPNDRSMTALKRAARRTTPESAEIMRMLLSYGADPEIECYSANQSIRGEQGAKEIHKHLGISWEELLEETSRSPRAREASAIREAERRRDPEKYTMRKAQVEKRRLFRIERRVQNRRERETRHAARLKDMVESKSIPANKPISTAKDEVTEEQAVGRDSSVANNQDGTIISEEGVLLENVKRVREELVRLEAMMAEQSSDGEFYVTNTQASISSRYIHALEDHQMLLMLLNKQNRKRMEMAKQEEVTTEQLSGRNAYEVDAWSGAIYIDSDTEQESQLQLTLQNDHQEEKSNFEKANVNTETQAPDKSMLTTSSSTADMDALGLEETIELDPPISPELLESFDDWFDYGV